MAKKVPRRKNERIVLALISAIPATIFALAVFTANWPR
jgi:hypothetical protein